MDSPAHAIGGKGQRSESQQDLEIFTQTSPAAVA